MYLLHLLLFQERDSYVLSVTLKHRKGNHTQRVFLTVLDHLRLDLAVQF
jgi:hypothetical protein